MRELSEGGRLVQQEVQGQGRGPGGEVRTEEAASDASEGEKREGDAEGEEGEDGGEGEDVGKMTARSFTAVARIFASRGSGGVSRPRR